MKQGVSVYKKTNSESTQVQLQSPSYDVRYSFITKDEFTSQYLSEENLSYCVAEPDEDEEDDYLLNHALQEDKKLCVTFWTKNYERICHAFSSERYNVTVSDTWSEEYKTVYVARKGVLSDFYDLEQIDEFYQKNEISINDGIFDQMFETEMIDILSGKYTHPALGIPYNIVIEFEGDDVLNRYGPEGIIIAGLLLGYPLEATADLIRRKLEYFITHPRF